MLYGNVAAFKEIANSQNQRAKHVSSYSSALAWNRLALRVIEEPLDIYCRYIFGVNSVEPKSTIKHWYGGPLHKKILTRFIIAFLLDLGQGRGCKCNECD